MRAVDPGAVSPESRRRTERLGAPFILGVVVALAASSCDLLSASLVPVGPDVSPGAPASAAPLGPIVAAGRVERPGAGFAITIPYRWTVEVASPDRPFRAAAPGEAWEALRATAPDRGAACLVVVGIAEDGQAPLDQGSGVGVSTAFDRPRWTMHEGTPTLRIPEPSITSTLPARHTVITSRERTRTEDPGLAHEVLYALACVEAGDGELTSITESLEVLASRTDPASPQVSPLGEGPRHG